VLAGFLYVKGLNGSRLKYTKLNANMNCWFY